MSVLLRKSRPGHITSNQIEIKISFKYLAIISNVEVMLMEAIIMKKTNLFALMVVAIAVMGLLLSGCVPQEKTKTVTATGNAEITADPDEAVVYLRIETTGDTAQEAKDENAEISDEVITALIKTGLTMDDIETENYNILEEYDWDDGERVAKGFRATHRMKVTTEDFDEIYLEFIEINYDL